MVLKSLLCLILFLQVCDLFDLNNTSGLPNAESGMWRPRVVNGYPAKLGDVPYQVAMKGLINRAVNLYTTFCGGSIIGRTKLLSAAHCFYDKTNKCHTTFYPGQASKARLQDKYAVAGNLYNKAFYTSDGADGQWRAIHKVYYPKNYVFPRHDISVVYLKRPFTFTSYISSIPMAMHNTDYHGKCLVSGYGRTGSGKNNQSGILLLAHLDLVPKHICAKVFRQDMLNFVCTSSRLTDVGKGDSGGPLVCAHTHDPNEKDKGVLVGVDKSEILLLADLQIITKQMCRKIFRKNMDAFVCTATSLTDVGKGDSGGPLVCANTKDPNEGGKGVLVGVVSGHHRGKGSFFTRVSRYQKFIKESKSISIFMFKYNIETYTAITVTLIYRTFSLF